jgi:hypothetical protein
VRVKNRAISIMALNRSITFGSSGTKTVAVACMGAAKVSLTAAFSAAPAAAPTIEFGNDGVNWPSSQSLAAVPGLTNVYETEVRVGGWKFVRVTLTAGAGVSDTCEANVQLHTDDEGQAA